MYYVYVIIIYVGEKSEIFRCYYGLGESCEMTVLKKLGSRVRQNNLIKYAHKWSTMFDRVE